jgi:hypothetical protein
LKPRVAEAKTRTSRLGVKFTAKRGVQIFTRCSSGITAPVAATRLRVVQAIRLDGAVVAAWAIVGDPEGLLLVGVPDSGGQLDLPRFHAEVGWTIARIRPRSFLEQPVGRQERKVRARG